MLTNGQIDKMQLKNQRLKSLYAIETKKVKASMALGVGDTITLEAKCSQVFYAPRKQMFNEPPMHGIQHEKEQVQGTFNCSV